MKNLRNLLKSLYGNWFLTDLYRLFLDFCHFIQTRKIKPFFNNNFFGLGGLNIPPPSTCGRPCCALSHKLNNRTIGCDCLIIQFTLSAQIWEQMNNSQGKIPQNENIRKNCQNFTNIINWYLSPYWSPDKIISSF